jgi:hypothetical protein
MLRFVLSAVALAGVLATAPAAFADPLAVTASDHAEAVAPTQEQAALPAPAAWPSPSDATAPASAGRDKDIAPVGPGWG